MSPKEAGKGSEQATEPRWRRQPEQRPQQILDAALAEFSERGLEAARVEDIASRAGVSKATIYLYFPGKTELFREVMHRRVRGIRDAVSGSERRETAAASLMALIGVIWSQVRTPEFDPVHRLVQAEANAFPELVREYVREVRRPVIEAVQSLLDWGVDLGEFSPGDSAARARMLLALVIKHAVWCARPEFMESLGSLDDETVLRQLQEFYMAAIRGGDA